MVCNLSLATSFVWVSNNVQWTAKQNKARQMTQQWVLKNVHASFSFVISKRKVLEEFVRFYTTIRRLQSFVFVPVWIVGPVADAFCRRFGPRLGVMAGGLLICAGMLASSQATSILFLIASLGLVTGEDLRRGSSWEPWSALHCKWPELITYVSTSGLVWFSNVHVITMSTWSLHLNIEHWLSNVSLKILHCG